MSALTVSEVSRQYGVSTRMLRYYEKEGLLRSHRREGYAYRLYDEEEVRRLEQIVLLRKLRVPLAQIKTVLQTPDATTAVEVFRHNVAELSGEIEALSTIRRILVRLADELERTADVHVRGLLRDNDTLILSLQTLTRPNLTDREDQTMEELRQADSSLRQLRDVRIVRIPPATVAAAHHIGDDPEAHAHALIDRFVRSSGLCEIKPDLRLFGFNHPNPVDESTPYGYEAWVTIPDSMAVPAPLQKKRMPGGLYAAHMVSLGAFNEFEWMLEWVQNSSKYEFAGDFADQEHMCGLLDEHLNYVSHVHLENSEPEDVQFDLLLPVREMEPPHQ